MTIPIALTIAGSDSGGGAGIQADLKTFSALEVYGASVITALTAQNTRGVSRIHAVPAEFVTAQLDAVFGDLAVAAVKIGMVAEPSVIAAIVAALRRWRPAHVVFDPVMVATSGDRLVTPEAIEVLRRDLIPQADLITPNMPEAAVLLGEPMATDETAVAEQGVRLLGLGCPAVLIKGGHATGTESVDWLVRREGVVRLAAPRIETQNTHGTGCTLSSAIAARLARGDDLERAVGGAKRYISAALEASGRLQVGHGHGPVHHFHALWG
jgi:hydroxymethylpyrimidine/phosphomethylpyrimidine kinase